MKKDYIYADNAATTKMDIEVFEAMKPYLLNEYGNPSSLYSFARNSKSALQNSREVIAKCIGAKPNEIFFTSGGTESDNWAIKGVISYAATKKQILTSQIEHHAIINTCKFMGCNDYPVAYLPVDKTGIMLPSTLEKYISTETALVSVIFANNEIGTIEPIKQLCEIAHKNNVLFHTDAVQAVGHIDIDVDDLDVDLLSASAHKFNGPKGIGFLYIKEGSNIIPYINGGIQENKQRAGTENVASIVGMATALDNNCNKIKENQIYLNELSDLFFNQLNNTNIDFIVNGSKNKLPGLISISIKNFSGEMLLHRLDLEGIAISTGSACNSKSTEISHVIKAIEVPYNYSEGTIRISFGKYNTKEEVLQIVRVLNAVCSRR